MRVKVTCTYIYVIIYISLLSLVEQWRQLRDTGYSWDPLPHETEQRQAHPQNDQTYV